ncbi:hypothetical protein NPIL_10521, partial [Nephila pilipes]
AAIKLMTRYGLHCSIPRSVTTSVALVQNSRRVFPLKDCSKES